MTYRTIFLILTVLLAMFSSCFVQAADNVSSTCMANGTFDKDKCFQEARWVAVGTAIDVHTLSYPQDKPMTEFTLKVTTWEKGTKRIKKKQEIKYLAVYFSGLSSGDSIRVYGYERVKHLPDKEYGALYIEGLVNKE